MATVKLATLAIRTIAKPISSQLKNQAKQHPAFRNLCVSLAQGMHTAEVSLRTNILGEPARAHVRPLSEARAIETGANALAEGFLFAVAAALIVGESFRTSRAQSRRRDDLRQSQKELEGERERNDELQRIMERVGGWVEFEDTPFKVPRVNLTPQPARSESTNVPAVGSTPFSSSDVNSASSPGAGPS
ncbi:OPA3-domain-containing protein [Pisolithus orientalis]|uniref:OPA3-domain-containing protein n=1 Tax=Pisolithus orientalis TaxID=936130 RepID=UPI0022254A2F|nr:OPA3-domain-containing protein [Pisolithus orientalis]KAI5993148.1 OPA3-domain-containing protein [Pisolithus orientalis]